MEKNSKNCGFEIKSQSAISLIFFVLFLFACGKQGETVEVNKPTEDFKVRVDRFADLEILRYRVSQFEELSLRQKKFVYFLSQAALSGRDILYDQNYKYNLIIRQTIHTIVEGYKGDRSTESWKQFMTYTKSVWFSNGIRHHYSTKQMLYYDTHYSFLPLEND